MLLDSAPVLEDIVVERLARSPAVTAAELHALIAAGYDSYSVQGVYQELRKLIARGVVLKVRDRYSLRLAWVLEMMELTDSMYESYLSNPPQEELLPPPGEKRSWRFHDLHSLVAFYTQLALLLVQHGSERTLYEYVPHVWYHLAHSQDEEQFLRSLELARAEYYLVVAGDTFLDRTYSTYSDHFKGAVRFGHQPVPQRLQRSYLAFTSDTVCTLKLDAGLEQALEHLYDYVQSRRDMDVGRIQDLFHQRARISVTVERDGQRAARLVRRFRSFFGLTTK